jgi:hypothetical protein
MGETLIGISAKKMRRIFGPSRRLNKKSFAKAFGSDQYLLEQTNKRVAKFEQSVVGKSGTT